jgi:hypothetical protein
VLRLVAQVARALKATHEVDGVHRDVKGENVLVRGEDTRAMLMDFGAGDFRGARTLTREPLPPGTPQYRSPEALLFQWRWRRPSTAHYEAGPADDVYALGMLAYRLATGMYPPTTDDDEDEVVVDDSRLAYPALVPPEAQATMSPELAAFIRQMLSHEPTARGSAAEVAEALEYAAMTAGPEADQPITPRAVETHPMTPRAVEAHPARTARTAPRRHPPAWLLWLTAAVGVQVVINVWWSTHWQSVERPPAVAQEGRDGGTEDGGTASLADAALTRREDMALPVPAQEGISLEMPKKPFPGQRRPPCKKPETEINGGCWIALLEAVPPCGDTSYEWRNKCYYPVAAPQRPTTSEQP